MVYGYLIIVIMTDIFHSQVSWTQYLSDAIDTAW